MLISINSQTSLYMEHLSLSPMEKLFRLEIDYR